MSDFGEYDGDTVHDMWVDYTYHENTGDLTDWYGDDNELPERAIEYPDVTPVEKARLHELLDVNFPNRMARCHQEIENNEAMIISMAKKREKVRTGWTLGACLLAILVSLVIFLTIYG